jgi:bacillithiol biosynthesis cysteine-adding enzyme BshC
MDSLRAFRKIRQSSPADRQTLLKVLKLQYEALKESGEPISPKVLQNLEKLGDPKTFTVTTGHQLQVAGGPLFFTYKILSAIRLAMELDKSEEGYTHVPVLWLASEDHDMQEISTFRVKGRDFTWDSGWKGASGRAPVKGLPELMQEVEELVSADAYGSEISSILRDSYKADRDLSLSTRIFVNRLFGRFGLIVLDADHRELKKSAVSVFSDELLRQSGFREVAQTVIQQSAYGSPQVEPRPVNLFLLSEDDRKRIDPEGDHFVAAGTDLRFSREEIIRKLQDHPEQFSPNVVLRPLYQESVLPNLAYIGGPSEVAYWLELKSLFEYHRIPFPAVLIRNSFLVLNRNASSKADGFGWQDLQLLEDLNAWIRREVLDPASAQDPLPAALQKLDKIYDALAADLRTVDPTLEASVNSEAQKSRKGLHQLQEKRSRALKRREETVVSRLRQLDDTVRPGGVFQERSESLITFYASFGPSFIDELLRHCLPVNDSLTVLRELQATG